MTIESFIPFLFFARRALTLNYMKKPDMMVDPLRGKLSTGLILLSLIAFGE
jgi:hypothetical protein